MSFKQRLGFAFSVAGLAAVFLSGCAGPAPSYSPSVDNVERLKKANAASTKLGAFVPKAGMENADAISLRAASMVSPVGKNFADYLAAALRSELELAKLYDPASAVEVSGTLLRNNVNAGGISTNDGQLEAQFVVKRNAEVRYDKVKKVTRQWDGAFAGAVAVPQAANNYPLMVQQLLAELFADPEFLQAIQKR